MHLRTLENDNQARPVPNACFTGSAQKQEWCPYVPRVGVGPSKASPEALRNLPLQPHLFCGCKKTRCSSYLFSASCPTPSSAYTAKASISSLRLSCFFFLLLPILEQQKLQNYWFQYLGLYLKLVMPSAAPQTHSAFLSKRTSGHVCKGHRE